MNTKTNFEAYRREWLIEMYSTIKNFLIAKKEEETITEEEEAQAQDDLKFLIANLSMYYYSKDIKRQQLDISKIFNTNRNLLTIAILECVREKACKKIDESRVVIMVNAIDFDTERSKKMEMSENYLSLVNDAMVRLKDLIYKSANQE